MKDDRLDQLITMNPEVLVGKPIIRGTRISVDLIAGFAETGMTPEEIVDDYPDLTIEEVVAATIFAKKIRKKVVAYITNGQRLLVFDHPLSPEAGIQVPAGTMNADETPAEAVLREAEEETGLAGLEIVSFLGQRYLDLKPYGKDEIHHRHFFHLNCPGTPADQWDWIESEPSDSSDPIPFSFHWVDLASTIPKLAAQQDDLLHLLGMDVDARSSLFRTCKLAIPQSRPALEHAPMRRKRSMAKHRIYTTSFASVYPLLTAKAEKKGRTQAEVDQVIRWLTGYDQQGLEAQLANQIDCETFFAEAPRPNPSRSLITGKVCGVQVETIEDSTMREIRYLDKLIDELAKGKSMEKILRTP